MQTRQVRLGLKKFKGYAWPHGIRGYYNLVLMTALILLKRNNKFDYN